jgi:hypothetical protein
MMYDILAGIASEEEGRFASSAFINLRVTIKRMKLLFLNRGIHGFFDTPGTLTTHPKLINII